MRTLSGLLTPVLIAGLVGTLPGGASAFAPAEPESPTPVAEPEAQPEVPAESLHDPMVEARRAYDLGRKLYDEAKYEEALGSFLDAQRLYASPDHHFNIARCYEALGRYELAVEYYGAYLRSDPADRANIENTIARINTIIESKNKPAQPETPVAATEPTEPDPGAETTTDAEPSDRGPYPGRGMVIAGGALIGVGAGLAIGAGVGAGVAAQDRSDKVDAVLTGGNPDGLGLDATRTLDEEGRRFETLQIAGAVLGGVVAAGGVALLIVGLRKKKNAPVPSAMLGRGMAGVSLRGSF